MLRDHRFWIGIGLGVVAVYGWQYFRARSSG